MWHAPVYDRRETAKPRPLRIAMNIDAPAPARGSYAAGFESVARTFAEQLESGQEVGAALSVYHRGRQVVSLFGGLADVRERRAWQRDTRICVFSVTKGFAAIGMHLLAARGRFDWDEPVATYWPKFAAGGKEAITVRALLNHRAGLPYLETPVSLAECLVARSPKLIAALEAQVPIWAPGTRQAYHAVTYGMYVSELFARLAGEPLGVFLQREWFDVVGSDARLGTPAEEDSRHATLYPPSLGERVIQVLGLAAATPGAPEVTVARSLFSRDSVPRRAFSNPAPGLRGPLAYNDVAVRRAELAWGSATASADGVARAYLPFAGGGRYEDQALFAPETLAPLHVRQSWSTCDETLKKPLGWSQGFLKEERHQFCPNTESFGHAGMGGALGWCDPIAGVTIGYVVNRMDARVRSPRCLALCRALYESPPLRG